VSLGLLAILAGGLTACGGGEDTTVTPPPAVPAAPATAPPPSGASTLPTTTGKLPTGYIPNSVSSTATLPPAAGPAPAADDDVDRATDVAGVYAAAKLGGPDVGAVVDLTITGDAATAVVTGAGDTRYELDLRRSGDSWEVVSATPR
jgi:hypothetical protein